MSRVYIHPKWDEVSLERVLFALSDPIRLNMVRMLASSTRVNSLSLGPGMPRSTITHHTRILRESGLTRTLPDGRNCWISLRRNLLNEKFPGLLEIILKDHSLASDTKGN
ncbi:ArsR/SmtB family transcription factor [Dickeya chrysanthemi]|uniref:ArsR/SmtB family transcription factor n=1 Tax=Dickeya chrysanthemi TaxID=556 RepID=UPI0008FBCF12|nr:ArsR family transcriptional regulator [Dickeya chrysanthemi]MBX9447416.1 helix-turn-helix transcriptional regulator [Dickeya chrysanthemi]MCA7008925.1 ArsR family transcriptional regulator [Dickeya chrysanthemi]